MTENIYTTHSFFNGITLRHNLESGHVETVILNDAQRKTLFSVTNPLLATTLGAAPWLATIPSAEQVREMSARSHKSEGESDAVLNAALTQRLSELIAVEQSTLLHWQRLTLPERTSDSLGLNNRRWPIDEDRRAEIVAEAAYEKYHVLLTPSSTDSMMVLDICVEDDLDPDTLLCAARLMWPCAENTEDEDEQYEAAQASLDDLVNEKPEMIQMLVIAAASPDSKDGKNAVACFQQHLTQARKNSHA